VIAVTTRTPKDPAESRLARSGVALIVAGFFVFLIGVFPQVIALALTAGIGVLQILVFLFGLGMMLLGAYIYLYATRHRALEASLREEVGRRLIATGYVFALASGFADVLGIGSHVGGLQAPYFGWLQASGIALGGGISTLGLFLYASRR
jgi:MFS family permease